jgi:hypothetical protein
MKTILLIPVFRGGALFEACLKSVRPYVSDFEKIIVSINGGKNDRELDKEILAESGITPTKLILLETDRSLTGPAHNRLALKNILKLGFSFDSQIMALFHDDWLQRSPLDCAIDLSTVLVGDWLTNESSSQRTAISLPRQKVTDWIEKGGYAGAFINGSGMIASLRARYAASLVMSIFRTGVRYEFFLMTHKSVSHLERTAQPLVKIRFHPDQDGLRQTAFSTLRGDVAFFFWLLFQGRINSRKSLGFAMGVLSSGIHSAVIRALKK